MPAPGGDFLARLFLGSDKVDELDYRNQAAARAYKAAGREFRAMRNGEPLTPSESRYSSSSHESTPVPLQRRGTAGHEGGGRDTYGGGGPARRADTQGARYSTRAGAGGQSQKLMMDPYGVGDAASPRGSTRQPHVVEGPAGHSSKQVRSSSSQSKQGAGRSHGVSVRDAAAAAASCSKATTLPLGNNTHRSVTKKSHAAAARGKQQADEESYHETRAR